MARRYCAHLTVGPLAPPGTVGEWSWPTSIPPNCESRPDPQAGAWAGRAFVMYTERLAPLLIRPWRGRVPARDRAALRGREHVVRRTRGQAGVRLAKDRGPPPQLLMAQTRTSSTGQFSPASSAACEFNDKHHRTRSISPTAYIERADRNGRRPVCWTGGWLARWSGQPRRPPRDGVASPRCAPARRTPQS